MGAWDGPDPPILRLRSRPSEIPDRQDVFVVAAGRVVDPGGHPERIDDHRMGTASQERGDFWSGSILERSRWCGMRNRSYAISAITEHAPCLTGLPSRQVGEDPTCQGPTEPTRPAPGRPDGG